MKKDNDVYCGACWDPTRTKIVGDGALKDWGFLEVENDTFLCRACLILLPPGLRKRVMMSAGDAARSAREEALRFLGAPIEERRLALPRPRLRIERTCQCENKPPRPVEQVNFLSDDSKPDQICDRCGARIKRADGRGTRRMA